MAGSELTEVLSRKCLGPCKSSQRRTQIRQDILLAIYELDPIRDPRWPEFLARDHRASVFHAPGWLQALSHSYGYEPIVLTTTPPGQELANGAVFCRVDSWLTGRRLVSLPFSDHCEPLLQNTEELAEIGSFLQDELGQKSLRYVEIRPLDSGSGMGGMFFPLKTFCFHTLDLRPGIEQLFENLHKDCIRRKIRRARREGLSYERGTSPTLLHQFYELFVMTRQRHGLPPSPYQWFHNLRLSLGDTFQVHIAAKDGQPVAGILTLTYKDCIYYKYGASDVRHNRYGGMPFLLWMAILEAKAAGLQQLDLGRCESDNAGLIAFKDRWGSERSTLTYWSLPTVSSPAHPNGWKLRLAKTLFAHTPIPLRIAAGQILYRHVG